jgi:hypothetical protein
MDTSTDSLVLEHERIRALRSRLAIFPPDGDATWAVFRNLDGLCDECFSLCAPPDSQWTTTSGFKTQGNFHWGNLRIVHESGMEGCQLCSAIYQATIHYLETVPDTVPNDADDIEVSILGPSDLEIRHWHFLSPGFSSTGSLSLTKG